MFTGHTGPIAPGSFRLALALLASMAAVASAQDFNPQPIVHKVTAATERMELTVNSSRVLTLDQKIPRAQVNNRELLDLTPLSPTEIQVFAKKAGVTQINLWNEAGEVHSVDVVIYGDARELAMLLEMQFPHATIKVTPLANSVVLSGFVDRPDHVSQIIRMAEDYYPKVIPNITVGGVQQILLSVKVMEVSRTKLRAVGFDFAAVNGDDFLVQSVSGLIEATGTGGGVTGLGQDTVRFGIVDGDNAFFGFLEALRRYELGKILAEPKLVTVSGRPAFFRAGGEFPILVPQSLGTVSIEYKQFGTRIDFVPIVLGNGNIRLEVRPQVSEIDNTRSVEVGGTSVPGLRIREVETACELKAGQTLALAGLVQNRIEATNTGIPVLADLPYFGAPFRRVRESNNEIELLILVTPQLVDALDCGEVPPCGPGMASESPDDCNLYLKGHLEVPSRGPCGFGCGVHGHHGRDMIEGEVIEGEIHGDVEEIRTGPVGTPTEARRRQPAKKQSVATGPTSPTKSKARQLPPGPVRPATANMPISNKPQDQSRSANQTGSPSQESKVTNPGLIGPVGYDVIN